MKKIRLAVINSNAVAINQYTKKGTEIFDYIFITNLKKLKQKTICVTSFCSGNSRLPVKIESIGYYPSNENPKIGEKNMKLFELALINKALKMKGLFDIYHVNMGAGDNIMLFAEFVKKPFVVTMHGPATEPFVNPFFSLFKNLKNVYFVSVSNHQRKFLPYLNYIKTIYHGVDTTKFIFNPVGGQAMIWTGRAIPEKGLDTVMFIAKRLKKPAQVFPIMKDEYLQWLHHEIIRKRDLIDQIVKISIDFNVQRKKLIKEYQNSRLFLFPVRLEESFGLVLIESMACGTPVVAYARGSVPEVIKDGETGFIINPSDTDIRGNFIIKKTGIEGLCEAVERIYSMPEEEYRKMRLACRAHVEKNFTVERMVDEYENVYRQILNKK